jgi:hypothetical protein
MNRAPKIKSKLKSEKPDLGPATAKRNKAPPSRVETLATAKGPQFPAGRMLISSPRDIEAVIERIPSGRVLRVSDLRLSLAKSHKADYTCPLTTGIFVRVAAEAADEERAVGLPGIPYWRLVRDDGSMFDKFPGGAPAQIQRLQSEGVEIFFVSKRAVIADLEAAQWKAPPMGKKAGLR